MSYLGLIHSSYIFQENSHTRHVYGVPPAKHNAGSPCKELFQHMRYKMYRLATIHTYLLNILSVQLDSDVIENL